jgi:HEAT repeat protein
MLATRQRVTPEPSSPFLLLLVFSLASATPAVEATACIVVIQSDAARVVEQMRGMSIQRRPMARSDGRIDPLEQRRSEITASLRELGDEAIDALARALVDRDVQMRRNAALVLIDRIQGR